VIRGEITFNVGITAALISLKATVQKILDLRNGSTDAVREEISALFSSWKQNRFAVESFLSRRFELHNWLHGVHCFIVGHEYGHYLVPVDGLGSGKHSATQRHVEKYVRGHTDVPSSSQPEVIGQWTSEVAADIFALRVCTELEEYNPFAVAWNFSSFAALQCILETYFETVGAASSRSHPDSHARVTILRDIIEMERVITESFGIAHKSDCLPLDTFIGIMAEEILAKYDNTRALLKSL